MEKSGRILVNQRTATVVSHLLSAFSLLFIVWLLLNKVELLKDWFIDFTKVADFTFWFCLFLTFCMMPLNWYLESRKWALLKSTTLRSSTPDVLRGLSYSQWGGFIGQLVGRLGFSSFQLLRNQTSLVLWNSFHQSAWTIVMGLISLAYLHESTVWFLVLIACSIVLFLAILFFQFDSAIALSSHLKLFILSGGRYLVFHLQFLAVAIGLALDQAYFQILSGYAVVLLSKFFTPAINRWTELIIRGAVSVWVAKLLFMKPEDWVIATTLLWLINIAFPASIGVFFRSKSNQSTST